MKLAWNKVALAVVGSVMLAIAAGCSSGPSTVQEGTPPSPNAHPDTRNLGSGSGSGGGDPRAASNDPRTKK